MVEFNILDIFKEDDALVVKYGTIADDGKPEVAEAQPALDSTPSDIEAWAKDMQALREELNLKAQQRKLAKQVAAAAKKERVRSELFDLVQTNYT